MIELLFVSTLFLSDVNLEKVEAVLVQEFREVGRPLLHKPNTIFETWFCGCDMCLYEGHQVSKEKNLRWGKGKCKVDFKSDIIYVCENAGTTLINCEPKK